jgi:hypothetical protein
LSLSRLSSTSDKSRKGITASSSVDLHEIYPSQTQ